jgi:hypothetical protein
MRGTSDLTEVAAYERVFMPAARDGLLVRCDYRRPTRPRTAKSALGVRLTIRTYLGQQRIPTMPNLLYSPRARNPAAASGSPLIVTLDPDRVCGK